MTTDSSDASGTPSADFHRLSLTVGAPQTGDAVALLTDLLGTGCQERARVDGRVDLDFWLSDPETISAATDALDTAGIAAVAEWTPETLDWEAQMRSFHRPVHVGRLYVRPPWEPARGESLDLVIDPGMAFGTGQHPTTNACLELLQTREPATVLDAGCGSGVLAIAARLLGHEPVTAIDDDPAAVAATRANARANGVGITVARRRIGVDALPAVDGVLANLTASVMPVLSQAIASTPPRWAILSGLRTFEAPVCAEAFAPCGLRIVERRGDGRWTSLLLTR